MSGFFGPRDDADDASGDPAAEDSLARIEAGGIPLAAELRLKGLGADGALFTSGLSVGEYALLGRVGPRPLAQVLGASVLHVGWQYLPALAPYYNPYAMPYESPYDEPTFWQRRQYQRQRTVVCELDTLTQAWGEVRRLALGRLSEEALQVGADAVVGVHLARGEHDWAKGTIDYLVSGTAIRVPGSRREYWPLLSDLSVQDYWRLYNAGYEPAGLLATTTVVFVSASRSTRWQHFNTYRDNQELDELSRGFYLARDNVREELRSQVMSARGVGAVGVWFSHTVHKEEFQVERSVQPMLAPGWHRGRLGLPFYVSRGGDTEREGWVITMHGAGTAIRRGENVPQYPPEKVLRLGHT